MTSTNIHHLLAQCRFVRVQPKLDGDRIWAGRKGQLPPALVELIRNNRTTVKAVLRPLNAGEWLETADLERRIDDHYEDSALTTMDRSSWPPDVHHDHLGRLRRLSAKLRKKKANVT